MKATLYITPDGTIRAVGGNGVDRLPLDEFGQITRRRASHVWPVHPVKRIAFRILRAVFGERGHIAEWCRHWYGPWEVRFAETPHLVQFTAQSRRVCIEWEISQLNERLAREN